MEKNIRNCSANLNDPIYTQTNGIPISQNLACKILHIGKAKARKLLAKGRIEKVESKGNYYGFNLADVLNLIGKEI